MKTTLTIYTNLIIKCLLCINQLRNECPMNSVSYRENITIVAVVDDIILICYG